MATAAPKSTAAQASAKVAKSRTSKVATSQAKSEESLQAQRIRIKLLAYDAKIIDQTARTILETAERAGATVRGPIPLPTLKHKVTVNRSTFVHKDSREQYEMRVHKRLLDIVEPDSSLISELMSLSLPAGVDVEIKM